MYDTGEGVPEEDVEAARWYRLAAEQGVTEAQSNRRFQPRGVQDAALRAAGDGRLTADEGEAERCRRVVQPWTDIRNRLRY